ncbi:MAG: FAD-dependent oxidoreductase [Candidatus Gastranaerophilales bacterium]|nr:FAD-dependent oxidoreductase [Candidatus Gastranaerophilales bacterium]
MAEQVVIIGGGAAGPKTAAKLRRERSDIKIDLYTQEDIISYSACGLPYFLENTIQNYETLIIRTPEDFQKQNIDIHLKQRCIDVDTDNQYVLMEDLTTNTKYKKPYNILVIATGAKPVIPNIPNINLKNIFTLRTIQDGINIKEKMLQSKKAVLLGGGYISIEVMEAFVQNNLQVTLIEKEPQILKMFDEDFSQRITDYIIGRNPGQVNILLNEEVVAFSGNTEGGVKSVITNTGKEIETDLVVLGTGVRPNTDFLINSGIKLSIKNSIKVDKTLKTSKNGVYAAGDCTDNFNLITNRYTWVPMGSTANKEGRCAAINIAGGNCLFDGILNSTITKYFEFTISIIGISYKEALEYGFQPEFAIVTKKDKAGYMPNIGTVTLKLIADKNTHTILGIQGIGDGEVNQRINTVIPAILSKTKLESFMHLDLPYSPPYSPAIDPVLNAAQIIYQKINS